MEVEYEIRRSNPGFNGYETITLYFEKEETELSKYFSDLCDYVQNASIFGKQADTLDVVSEAIEKLKELDQSFGRTG